MKKTVLLALMAISMAACSPKTAGNAAKGIGIDLVRKTFTQMINAQNAGDISKALDFTYPKLFEMMPREQMEAMFGQLASMGIQSLTENVKITDLSEAVTSGDYSFSKAKLAATSKLIPNDKTLLGALEMQSKQIYGGDAVRKTADAVEVDVNEDLYIIQEPSTKKMYFLQANDQLKPMLGQLLPTDVVEKLK